MMNVLCERRTSGFWSLVGLVSCAAVLGGVAKAVADVRRDAVVEAIEKAMPSVVNISTETIVEVRDPFQNVFREFFGPYWGRRSQQSLGSGVIIDETGYVLTNLHVVQRANRITVTLADGRVFEAQPIIGAFKRDVALLKLITNGGAEFKAIKFAPDDDLLLGETVLALGNPFGLGGSVSRGILSSKARRPPVQDESLDVQDWLQTDAAINPGNSGGPLINLRGELIGISVAVYREGQGIGFAIPIKRVSEALADIFTPEAIKALWFGARFLAGTNGLTVASIQAGSPAEKAGLRPGDKVTHVNATPLQNLFELHRELLLAAEQAETRLVVQRGKDRKTLPIRLVPEKTFFNAKLIHQKLGTTLQELTPQLAASMGFHQVQGLLVSEVEENGPAARAGLREGYLIQAFDGQAPRSLTEAAKMLYAKPKGDTAKLTVLIPRTRGNFLQLVSTRKDVILR